MPEVNLQVSSLEKPISIEQSTKPSRSAKIAKAAAGIVSVLLIVIGVVGIAVGASGGLFIASAVGLVLGAVLLVSLASVMLVSSIQAKRAKRKLEVKLEEVPLAPEEELTVKPKEKPVVHPAPQEKPTPPKDFEIGEKPLTSPETADVCARTHSILDQDEMDWLPRFLWRNEGIIAPSQPLLTEYYMFCKRRFSILCDSLKKDANNKYHYPTGKQAKEKFLENANNAMEAAVLLGNSVVRDLCSRAEDYLEDTETDLEALASQDHHFHRTMPLPSSVYIFIRFFHENCSEKLDKATKDAAKARFYTPGTPEYKFRLLYNDYCKLIRWRIGDPSFAKSEQEREIYAYSEEDTGPDFRQPNR
ncbi:hypothetical protein [Chlamydia vaughanii]|uniref:hypothetical protein n=1 Tax=Chlamydia vaughanii TaxID=3112552 RepID=UPI0032B12BC5